MHKTTHNREYCFGVHPWNANDLWIEWMNEPSQPEAIMGTINYYYYLRCDEDLKDNLNRILQKYYRSRKQSMRRLMRWERVRRWDGTGQTESHPENGEVQDAKPWKPASTMVLLCDSFWISTANSIFLLNEPNIIFSGVLRFVTDNQNRRRRKVRGEMCGHNK